VCLSNNNALDLRALTAKIILSLQQRDSISIGGGIRGGWEAWWKLGIGGRLGGVGDSVGEHVTDTYSFMSSYSIVVFAYQRVMMKAWLSSDGGVIT
jgi:hypothetical protein